MQFKLLKMAVIGSILLVSGLANVANAGLITITEEVSTASLVDTLLGDGSTELNFYSGVGFTIGETFQGLSVNDPGGTSNENFILSNASNPLSLLVGTASNGVGFCCGGIVGLAGGSVNGDDIGEGVIAILFDFDVTNLGLRLLGGGGTTSFHFFDSNGLLMDTVTSANAASYAFTSSQAYRGVAIETTRIAGQAYADLRFDRAVEQVPEPSTLAIFALGMIGLASRRFKK